MSILICQFFGFVINSIQKNYTILPPFTKRNLQQQSKICNNPVTFFQKSNKKTNTSNYKKINCKPNERMFFYNI